MPRFETVLVPTDFSACSEVALETAVEFAKKLGARVRLLHVFHPPVAIFDPYGIQPSEPILTDVPQAARERLERELDRVKAAGVEAVAEIREGLPAEEVVADASEHDVDLIVMGTHGHTGLQHVLLGSVAERTVRTAACPVLTVKPRE